VPARGGDPAGDDVARAGPWRGPRVRPAARQLHAAVLSVGLTVAVLPLVAAGLRVAVGAAGLGLAAVLHTVGLLLLPGRSRLAARARVRHATDIVSLGLSLHFAAGVLLPTEQAPLAARIAVASGGFGFAADFVAALADRRRRPGAAVCLLGTGAAQFGLIALIVLLGYGAPDLAALAAVPWPLAGALLAGAGVRRVAAGDPRR
ncbi:GGDEF domain-containing protein, partial [Micromonospora harpali]